MAFVKLDCGMLDSTLWIDREAREVFITALLMAEPIELKQPTPQMEVCTLNDTNYTIPEGWYGFVPAAGPGIVRRAGLDKEVGIAALVRLCSPEDESRTPDHGGRRMARIDGGYLVLNYDKYRQKDHTNAERQKRFRERRNGVMSTSNAVTGSDVTQAEAEAEAKPRYRIDGLPENLQTPEFFEAWTAWEKHRREIKHSLTKSTVERQLKSLSTYGPVIAVATINKSIEMGWQGLFPDKINSNGKSNSGHGGSRNVGHNANLDYSKRPTRKTPSAFTGTETGNSGLI